MMDYLYRLKMNDSAPCIEYNVSEMVEHFLLFFQKYNVQTACFAQNLETII